MSLSRLVVALLCASAPLAGAAEPFADIRVDPPAVRLSGPDARYTLLVTGTRADGRLVDLTTDAKFDRRRRDRPVRAELGARPDRRLSDASGSR